MTAIVSIARFIASWKSAPFTHLAEVEPWHLTTQAPSVVRALLAQLSADAFDIRAEVAVHRTATVEPGAVLKGPLILGAGCFVAAGAYLRGGNWVDDGCTLGPGTELKSSFVFEGSRLGHFSFVGDSILGADVNLEAGSIVCNHRNERADKEIRVRVHGLLQRTGALKFGAVIGDGSRIGANAVLAPGTLLMPHSVVARAASLDQESDESSSSESGGAGGAYRPGNVKGVGNAGTSQT
ncbi:MAG: LpxA family transferase [Variovorax sp.]